MSPPDKPAELSASQKLAALVAKRQAARQPHPDGATGRRVTERTAAAASASKSKPAMRKG